MQRQPLDHEARGALVGVAHERSEFRGRTDLREERFERVRLLGDDAEHVEGVDIARALPDRVQRCLTIETRQRRFFHVAVPAEHLQRFADEGGRAFADPVFTDRRADTP